MWKSLTSWWSGTGSSEETDHGKSITTKQNSREHRQERRDNPKGRPKQNIEPLSNKETLNVEDDNAVFVEQEVLDVKTNIGVDLDLDFNHIKWFLYLMEEPGITLISVIK